MSFTSLSRIALTRSAKADSRVILDDAHPVHHLAEDVDARVRAPHELTANLEQRLGHQEGQGRGDDDASEADERGPLDHVVEHNERGDDENRGAPEIVQELEEILKLVHIVGHQGDDLTRGLFLESLGDRRRHLRYSAHIKRLRTRTPRRWRW